MTNRKFKGATTETPETEMDVQETAEFNGATAVLIVLLPVLWTG